MILRHLVDYYEQEILPKDRMAGRWENRPVSFAIELRDDGSVQGLLPLYTESKRGKMSLGRSVCIPKWKPRAVTIDPARFLCDSALYLLGIRAEGNAKDPMQCFAAAKREHLQRTEGIQTPAAAAVRKFFETWHPETAESVPEIQAALPELRKGCSLVFSYKGAYVQEDAGIKAMWNAATSTDKVDGTQTGICLVTGKVAPICKIHPSLPKLHGLQGRLISFGENAYESYGARRSRGYNAHVSEEAAIAYGTALSALLADDRHTMQVGDVVVVSWAEGSTAVREACQDMFNAACYPDASLKKWMESIRAGAWPGDAPVPETPFYILGLYQQSYGRIAVKFFLEQTFGDVIQHLLRHHRRMELAGNDARPSSIFDILRETMPHRRKSWREKDLLGKKERIPPHLVEAVTEAVLEDCPYPVPLYTSILSRIYADRDAVDENGRHIINRVTPRRVAIMKAYLMKNKGRKISMALDENNHEPSYILGRMFATLEDIQHAANPKVQRTIQSAYFSTAATAPAYVFPNLLMLSNQHLAKLMRDKPGAAVRFRKDLAKLMSQMDFSTGASFPKMFDMDEQGTFIIGYYLQKQATIGEIQKRKEDEEDVK